MPQPTPDDTTSVEVTSEFGITQVKVTKFTDKTKKTIASVEIRWFSIEGGDWDHYSKRSFADETGAPEVEFPGSKYRRFEQELKCIIVIDENGTITVTQITESNMDGSPKAGVTIPISPPGPPQAWSPP